MSSSLVSASKRLTIRDRTRRLRHVCVIGGIYLGWALSFLFSEKYWLRLGGFIALLLGRIHPRSNEVKTRLVHVNRHNRIRVDDLWRDLGIRIFELFRLKRTSLRFELSQQARLLFQSLESDNKGALILCSHFGNWEAMGVALNRFGFKYSAVSTQGKCDLVSRFIQSRRRALGVRVIDAPDAARLIVNDLQNAQAVALFVDVPAKRKGKKMSFLGRSVERSTIIQRLSKLSAAPTIFVFNQRDARGRYRIYAEEIPDDVDLIKWSHVRLEQLIHAAPSQWVWLLE